MIHTDYAIFKLRAYLGKTGMAKSRLATNAGVPEGCTRNIDSDEWNPTSDTLRKLEKALPEDFVVDAKDIINSENINLNTRSE